MTDGDAQRALAASVVGSDEQRAPAASVVGSDEQRAFAESVATAAERALGGRVPDWRPGEPSDDRDPDLDQALADAGWLSVAEDPELLPFAGPAAIELGRRLAPLNVIDALLSGPLLAGELVRYGGSGRGAALAPDRITRFRLAREQPVAYGDAIGVHCVAACVQAEPLQGPQAGQRIAAWIAASVGYAAGVGEFAVRLTTDYARQRRAFGTTLAGLAPVQQMLADAATTVRGLVLLSFDRPGPPALAYAGPALCQVTATCQQVTGAIGFTLEYPLQRAHRRARALALWSEAALDTLAPETTRPTTCGTRDR
jgi:alkylation response protein AidB-like acyl-CoA dehydrogenase